mmetsp:Transcript_72867/g.118204  ORF Transcript_72867/g.118204 Transcript_72867/m.118204 type:complete len:108 (+) Transcript_72867:20-343(+)|eukprot:CAMPEP_0179433722 /NCGR_PEP_ID=MMETSP0799-20121207/18081_1 /TAXON_ID=46947 /ORGANISM="Geminigera cryophila, Strain CCMP2564" /LENGTH=107 /DNA_ID=CAMNT_0021211875 /DNA_START=9 /DNA_END=332 /DNA_ORIENTATION=+
MQRMNPLLRTGLATLASKVQTPASRAMVAGQRSMSTDVPPDPKDLALSYMRELKSKMSSAYSEKISIPESDYMAAVDAIAAEKVRYGLENTQVEPRKEVSLKDLTEG